MKLQSIQNHNTMNTTKINTINFKSNEHREAELRELRRLREERKLEERKRQEEQLLNKIQYPELDNPMSTKMAGFLSKFTCAIQNASEHNVMEFFGDEETASNLRKFTDKLNKRFLLFRLMF